MIWHDVAIVLLILVAAYLDKRTALRRQEEIFRVDLLLRDKQIERLSTELNDWKRRAA